MDVNFFTMSYFPPNPEWVYAIALLLLPILLLSLVKNNQRKQAIKEAKLPPSPPKLPIIGNLHQLGKLPHQSLWKLSQKYGPIIQLQLGRIPTLVVSSPAIAKEVLNTHDLDCCSRPISTGPKKLSYNFLDIALSPYSDYWRELKKIFVSELLTAKKVQSYQHVREAEVDSLINSLSQNSAKLVNISEILYGLIDGIVGKIAFGKSYGGKQFKNEQNFGEALNEIMSVLDGFSAEDFLPLVGGIIDSFTGFRARLRRSFNNLDRYFEVVINEHVNPARPKQEYEDFVDVLVRVFRQGEGSGHLNNDNIKAIILDTFIGGVDTSSLTMVWAMSELMKNPRVMNKVQTEVRTLIGKKPKVKGDDVKNLKYLQMVIKETLRLHPVAPLLVPHEAMNHCKISGYDVYPKTRILVNAWAIARDANAWENPNEFYPERFEATDRDYRGRHFEYIPFGAGRRICPGITMSITTMEYTLANLLHCFDWEMPSGSVRENLSMEEESGLTIHKKEPLWLVPIRYFDNK